MIPSPMLIARTFNVGLSPGCIEKCSIGTGCIEVLSGAERAETGAGKLSSEGTGWTEVRSASR